jgi:hypothetical protein
VGHFENNWAVGRRTTPLNLVLPLGASLTLSIRVSKWTPGSSGVLVVMRDSTYSFPVTRSDADWRVVESGPQRESHGYVC